MRFVVINGPNLNITEFPEKNSRTNLDYNEMVDLVYQCCLQLGIETEFYQSNHEGDLIDEIQSVQGRADGIIINPAGYAHTSVAILDALRLAGVPAVEVLLQDPAQQESFRSQDFIAMGCQARFVGEGIQGYVHAAAYLAGFLRLDAQPGAHLTS